MRASAGESQRQDLGDRIIYRRLLVWVVSPEPSRVLSSEEMRAEGLEGFGRS